MGMVEDLSLRPVAARLGTVPDVAHRALHGLSREGLIKLERREIRILDRAGLESRAMLD